MILQYFDSFEFAQLTQRVFKKVLALLYVIALLLLSALFALAVPIVVALGVAVPKIRSPICKLPDIFDLGVLKFRKNSRNKIITWNPMFNSEVF